MRRLAWSPVVQLPDPKPSKDASRTQQRLSQAMAGAREFDMRLASLLVGGENVEKYFAKQKCAGRRQNRCVS